MNNARVVHLTTVHRARDVRIFHKECRTLAEAGYDVTVVAPDGKDGVDGRVQVVGLGKPRNRLERATCLGLRLYRLARRLRADVYHIHDPELLPIVWLLKVRTGAKAVYDVHEDYARSVMSKTWLRKEIRRSVAWLTRRLEDFFVRRIDHVVAATEGIARRFPPPKTTVVKNMPILGLVPATRKRTKDRSHRVVFLGGITEIRGAFPMVESLAYIPETLSVALHLIGPIDQGLLNRLERLPEFDRVRYLGVFDVKRAYEIAQGGDVGLLVYQPLPNHVEALPTKLFEYMMLGLPVVVSDFPLWREIVEGVGCGVVVDPTDPRDVARGISLVLTQSRRSRQMGKRGEEAVRRRYNWGLEAAFLRAVYEKVLSRRF